MAMNAQDKRRLVQIIVLCVCVALLIVILKSKHNQAIDNSFVTSSKFTQTEMRLGQNADEDINKSVVNSSGDVENMDSPALDTESSTEASTTDSATETETIPVTTVETKPLKITTDVETTIEVTTSETEVSTDVEISTESITTSEIDMEVSTEATTTSEIDVDVSTKATTTSEIEASTEVTRAQKTTEDRKTSDKDYTTEIPDAQNDENSNASSIPGSDRPCTFALLREYHAEYHRFPNEGYWIEHEGEHHFQPTFCQLQIPWKLGNDVSQCLQQADTDSILTTGDSVALRYYGGLTSVMNQAAYDCPLNRSDNSSLFIPDNAYYGKDTMWEKYFNVSFRHCNECYGLEHICSKKTGVYIQNVTLEHVGLSLTREYSVLLQFDTHVMRKGNEDNKYYALSFEDFFFRFYMHGKYPDVYIIFMPFHHENDRIVLNSLRNTLKAFMARVYRNIPRTTKIFFLPSYSEFQMETDGVDRVARASKIKDMNNILYEVLEKELLDPRSRARGFLDLWEISSAMPSWSIDGVHMEAAWYKEIMSIFMQIFCNSVALDAF